MKKILYLSIVDWNWIKQRPQMIAEELSKKSEVYCIYPVYHRKTELTNNKVKLPNLHLIPRFKVPFSGKSSFLKKIDDLFQHIFVAIFILKNRPDIVYTSFPTDYSFFLRSFSRNVIYDCMDNHPEFEKNSDNKKNIIKMERKLINLSSTVLVSSEYLKKELTSRYNIRENKIILVRNGYSGKILNVSALTHNVSNTMKIAYIGTVSTWFDFDILSKVVDLRDDIEFHIFGPVNVMKPTIKNVFFDGVINHDYLYQAIKDFDALIMPFQVNKIIEAVDPVKLYEYINFGKPIISVYYEEIKRFDKFVWFYSDESTFINCINNIKAGNNKYNNQERICFLNQNNWENRVEQINQVLGINM